jgi:hypothetical protein
MIVVRYLTVWEAGVAGRQELKNAGGVIHGSGKMEARKRADSLEAVPRAG